METITNETVPSGANERRSHLLISTASYFFFFKFRMMEMACSSSFLISDTCKTSVVCNLQQFVFLHNGQLVVLWIH